MDVSQINVLFLMNDVCKMYQNVYQTLIPVPMTNSFNNYLKTKIVELVEPITQNQINSQKEKETERVSLIQKNFSFQCKYVEHGFESNSDFLYENVVSALPEDEDESVLFTYWKFSLLHQISKVDFENVKRLFNNRDYKIPSVTLFDFTEEEPTSTSALVHGLQLEKRLSKNSLSISEFEFVPQNITFVDNFFLGTSVLSSEVIAKDITDSNFVLNQNNNLTHTTVSMTGYNQLVYVMYLALQSKVNFFQQLRRVVPVLNLPQLPEFILYSQPKFKPKTESQLQNLRGPFYIQNTCFMNTVLVGFLLFPSRSILDILYNTGIFAFNVLDKSTKFCNEEKMDTTDVESVALYSYNDQSNRIEFVLALREFYVALQIVDRESIEQARRKVYAKTIQCKTFTSNPEVEYGSCGESDAVYEYLNVLFNLENYSTKTTISKYYVDPNSREEIPECRSVRKDPISLLYTAELKYDVKNVVNFVDLLNLYEVSVANEAKGELFECFDIRGYRKRVKINYYDFRNRTVAFSIPRQSYVGDTRNFFDVRIRPDPVLELTCLDEYNNEITYNLYLRSIILHLHYLAHYVCLLCSPYDKKWYLYDSEKIELYANDFESMLTKSKEIAYVVDVKGKQVGKSKNVENFAMRHSYSVIYSSDDDVKKNEGYEDFGSLEFLPESYL